MDGCAEVASAGERCEESTAERITGAVCVNDCACLDGIYLNVFDGGLLTWFASHHDGRLSTLGEDDGAWACHRCLLKGRDKLGSADAILGLETDGSGESRRLILVAKNEFGVLDSLLHLVEVELHNKECGKVQTKGLLVGRRELSNRFHGLKVGIDEEASCVEVLCAAQLGLRK